MTLEEKFKILLAAMHKIANCPESDCARYVAKVDAIAVDALVTIEEPPAK